MNDGRDDVHARFSKTHRAMHGQELRYNTESSSCTELSYVVYYSAATITERPQCCSSAALTAH